MIPSKQITVMLAEDHTLVRQSLCALLNAEEQFKIVGEARNGEEAVEMARTLQPDVILMDIAMPLLSGLEATRLILAARPGARVIILSAHSDDDYVKYTSTSGIAGFLEKQVFASILTEAIRTVAGGNTFFSPAVAKRLAENKNLSLSREGLIKSKKNQLTPRESEVLQFVAQGLPSKLIAAELGISVKTVEKHRQHLMDKLNIHEIAGLTRYAIASGIVECGVQLTVT